MTRTIDNFLVKLDFDRTELELIDTRKYWYAGIMFTTVLAGIAIWQVARIWLG